MCLLACFPVSSPVTPVTEAGRKHASNFYDAMGGWLTGLAGERQTVPLPTRCQWLSHPECMWLRQQTIAPACAIVYMQRVGKTTGFTVIRFQLKAVGLKKPRGRNRDQMMSTGNDELTNLSGRVVTMTMPGFTAEVSLCENRGRYRSHGSPSGADRIGYHALVEPQACGAFKSLACNGLILGCVACAAFTPNVPAMVGCFAACLGTFYGYCRDCIDVLDVPETGGGGGGGGGGGSPAGGTCFPNKCCEWGDNGECTLCIPRTAACP